MKARRPEVDFIGEVYQTDKYHTYINAGFDYLYDKVGLYDCLRDVICNRRPASSITYYWQCEIDILPHMLYFLEIMMNNVLPPTSSVAMPKKPFLPLLSAR